MATMQWRDEWSLGVTELDSGRRELVGLYNELFLAMRRGDGRISLCAGLGRMLDHAEALYGREEEVMATSGYPDGNAHRMEHRDFLQRMRRFERTLAQGRLTLDLPVLQFIRHWLTGHLAERDGEYGCFLARHPEAAAALEPQLT